MIKNYIAPRNKLQRRIRDIWAEVLKLPCEQIGIKDDFFVLGGNSDILIKLASRFKKEFKYDLEANILTNFNTIEKLSRLIRNNIEITRYKNYLIDKSDTTNIFEPFLLTNIQQAYYLGRSSDFELGNVCTHRYLEYKFTSLDIALLEKSFNQLIKRHLSLRTIFLDNYQQHLKEYAPYKIAVHDLSESRGLAVIRDRLSHKVYNPEKYPLFDVLVSKFNGYYIVHFSIDYLITDLNSLNILFDEWIKLYNNPTEKLLDLSVHSRDYLLQYERIRASDLFKNAEKYWAARINNYNFELNLPLTTSSLANEKQKFVRITKTISNEIWYKLLHKTEQAGVSITTILLAMYGRVLSYFSGQSQVCINLTLSHRLPLHNQVNEIIGDFTSLELFNYVDNQSDTIIKQLQAIHETLWEDIEHNLFDGIDFQRLVKKEKSIPANQILAPVVFTSVLSSANKGLHRNILDLPLNKSYQGINYSISQTPQVWLDNKVYKNLEGLVLEWDYVKQLFDKEVIESMYDSYCTLIEYLAEIDWNTNKLPLITPTYKNTLLIEAANSYAQKISKDTLFSRYENTVLENSLEKNLAVIDGEKHLQYSYKELLRESNLLSRYIIFSNHNFIDKPTDKAQEKVSPRLIGILSEKSYNQVVSILSIMKSGYGYLPLSIDWPVGRIDEVLEQGNVGILLISKAQYKQMPLKELLSKKYRLLIIEEVLSDIHNNLDLKTQIENLELPIVRPDDVAYIIFTSGSTGKPKGVMISHKGALNTIDAVNTRFNVSPGDKILALSELSFDLSVYDVFGILAVGGTIIFPKQKQTKNPRHWLELVLKYQITLWNTVPQLAGLLIDETGDALLLPSLRLFLLSGDWIPTSLPDRIKNCNPQATVMSLGGATEGSIWSIWYEIPSKVPEAWTSIPYGVAMPNQRMYVLNHTHEHCPVNVPGEIYIGGEGVALNYFNDQEKTDASFIKHTELGRLYKTGDLGKWHKEGYIEFIGRKDDQVKLNGYRVELGEIENALSSYEGIKQSVALVRNHAILNEAKGEARSKYLVGYYMSDNRLDEEKILNYLAGRLPEYMIPSILVYLDKLPLTINGKLDRKALPDPEFIDSENYVAPHNELEAQVCRIWGEVLGLPEDKVGIHNDFFRLGGNSIIAMRLASKLNKELVVSISVVSIFKHNTIDRLIHYLEHNNEDEVIINKAVARSPEEQILSFAQERLWFIEKYEEGTNAYNIPMLFKLSSDAKVDVLEQSIKTIVSRHEVLRSVIREDSEGRGYQLILNKQEYPLVIDRITVANKQQLDQELAKSVNHVYDLSSEYPIKICLYELIGTSNNEKQEKSARKDTTEYYLSIVVHHIAFDGWSIEVFLKELQNCYSYHLVQSKDLPAKLNLTELSIQYKDFAIWQRNYLSGERLAKQLNYWKNKLDSYKVLNLITDKTRPALVDYRGKDINFVLDRDTSIALRELAKELKVSLYSVLLSGYYLMLRAYSSQDDIVIGTPIANRHYSQIENLIGFFVNTLALRGEIDSKLLVKEFIQKVGQEVVEAQLHQDLPFEKLVEELKVSKDLSRHPIFQVMFGVQGFGGGVLKQVNDQGMDSQASLQSNLLEAYTPEANIYNIAKFDLSTFIDDRQECLEGIFNYAVSLYNEETVTRFIETYTEILKQLAVLAGNNKRQEESRIENLSYLNEEQYKQIVYDWNQTAKDYPDNKTIHQLFEEQVERTPDNIAIIYEENKLTYRELNERANQLANHIRENNEIKPDTLIALCLDRSEHMLVAILAVLKAGGAYVPMDPTYPDERIRYILEDTATRLVLTNEVHKRRLEDISQSNSNLINQISSESNQRREVNGSGAAQQLTQQAKILAIDGQIGQEQLLLQSAANPKTNITSTNLAYIIYTSGTTGNPKGVMQLHSNVMRLFSATDELYKFNSNDVWTLFHSYVFDFTVWEIWGALTYGGKLVIPSHEHTRDLNIFYELCRREQVTVLNQTPSAFSQFADIAINKDKKEKLSSLRYIIFGGEALNLSQLCPWSDCYSYNQPKLINMYGITETTVHATYKLIEEYDLGVNSYIGKIIPALKAYVLSSNLVPMPIGAIGEFYIGGAGLARGYLNRSGLTAEKFIENPFQTEEEKKDKSHSLEGRNSRLYKTGDLVRWLPDGNLEYMGRNDFQVKIRGYRIELGEIENALSNYEGIKQSVVLARKHTILNGTEDKTGSKYLVGYYVADNRLDEKRILNYLAGRLPEYMVPSILVHLENLPLTINGKLDRKALPDPEFTNRESFIAPRNELEAQVCRIWGEVLGLPEEKVGIHDDFFRLGGDSIISIQLVSRLRQRLGVNISVKDILMYRNIERLYDYCLSKEISNSAKSAIKTEVGILSGEVPLLPIQEWFFNSRFNKPDHWNQAFIIKTPNLDLNQLKLSVARLVEHHDAFRLKYRKNGNIHINNDNITENTTIGNEDVTQYYQYYDSEAKPEELKILDIRSLSAKEGSKEFASRLNSILTDWQNNFNIEHGPIYSIGYIYGYEDGSNRIWFALHHLIVDAVSWRILTEDLRDIYNGKELGSTGSSYRQWVKTVRDYQVIDHNNSDTTTTLRLNEQEYWNNILNGYRNYSTNNKLTNLVIGENSNNHASFILSQGRTQQLLRESNRAYNTQVNDLLLTALAYTLSEITSNKVSYIILEGHGREDIDNNIDIARTVGWFTTIFPVRLEIETELGSSIKNIKESLRQIPNKGIGYGSIIGYKEALPRISFNYLGQFYQEDSANNSLPANYWNIVGESHGKTVSNDNQDYNIININGLVINNELQFSIVSKLDKDITNKIAKLFKQKLEEVIAYTVKQKRSYLTVSDIDNIISQEYLDKIQESRETEGVYLVNSLQQGFIYHNLNQGEVDDAYRVQLIWQYNSKIEIKLLQEAWSYAQKRFSSLRLRFVWLEELVQIIDKEGSLDWRYIDLTKDEQITAINTDNADILAMQELRIKQIQERDRLESYDLKYGSLFRVYIIKQRKNLYTCIFSNHHIILDGWSNPILLNYIHETYLKLLDKKPVLFKTDRSYGYAQQYLQERQYNNSEYWHSYISQIEERSDLSTLLSSENKLGSQIRINDYRHIRFPEEQELRIVGNLYSKLKGLSQKKGVTLNAVLQYVWHKVLHIYGNSNQTVVGTTVSGRNIPVNDIETSVGLYINTLPLIVDHQSQVNLKADRKTKSVIESIKDIQDNINEINNRSNISLASLQKMGERLFDSLFVYENYPNPKGKSELDRLKISFLKGIEKLDYPLGVIVYENASNKEIKFIIKYAGELFAREVIDNLLSITNTVLEQIVNDPDKKVLDLTYLNEEQYKQIVYDWNQTAKDYPDNKTIHQLFEEQVERTPDNIAIIYEENKLTYRELNERANQLANHIRENNEIKPDTLIALCLDRSEHMLVAILAVLKAGGAYVPMDPTYPDERIRYILEDTATRLVLTNEVHKRRLEDISQSNSNLINQISSESNQRREVNGSGAAQQLTQQAKILAIDGQIGQEQLLLQSAANPKTNITSTNLAYIIYTSGTTGNPKGVMIEHKSYTTVVQHMRNLCFPHKQNIRTYSITNYVFDIFGLEYGIPLFSGGTISIGFSELSTLDCLKFDFIQMTPSVCNLMLNYLMNTLHLQLFIGGESLSKELLSKGLNKFRSIIHVYGPTETTIWSTAKIYSGLADQNLLSVILGKPLINESTYVLSPNLVTLPIGAIGELYIGGIGLARGYLNSSKLTAEKFLENPFQTEEEKKDKSHSSEGRNARLYKTGDLVRWLPDGNLEYIGRNDDQVKIRGYRIELGEIENTLSSYEGIKQSVVFAREHTNLNQTEYGVGSKYLVVYYVADNKLDEEKILKYLAGRLPEYMVPNILVYLEKLPLTINGKLDRKALPDPEFIDSENYVAPHNELEAQVCRIWGEVLGLPEDKVGIHNDFFRLGGNSIIAMRLASKLNKELVVSISVVSIFKHNTIDRLIHYLEHNNEDEVIINKAVARSPEEQILSFAQERLWFIEKYEEGTNAYNIPMLFKLSSDAKVDVLEQSIKTIVSRHEVLRSVIREDSEGRGYQLILNKQEYPLVIDRITVANKQQLDQELAKSVNHVYDLSSEYPIKICLYELIGTSNNEKQEKSARKDTTEYYLSIVVHHIAFDGWSIEVFLKELQNCYSYHLVQSKDLPAKLNLTELSIQYKDFAIWQRNYLSGERLAKQLNYWKNKLDSYKVLNLITDKTRPALVDYRGKDINFVLDRDTSIALRELAKELKVSLYSVLLSGYYLMLRAYSSQDDIVIGTPIANRHYSQIENLIGFFVNTLALRGEIDSKLLVKEFIQKVGQEVVEAQLHQDLPFEKLVEELKVSKDLSRHPIFQVMFGVQGFGGGVLKQVNDQGMDSQASLQSNLLEAYTPEANIYNIAKFDLSTFIDDRQECLEGIFNYAVSLYNEETVTRFIETYTEILKQLAVLAGNNKRQEESRIENLSYLNEEQYKQIVYDWNQTAKDYPDNKTIHQLFEEQVERTPDNIAIIYEENKLTYRELNERANQLANHIRENNEIKPDTLIALCLDRSEHMLVAILAVLKAGGAYVPMDPTYPDERIRYILEDTNAKIILANEAHAQRIYNLIKSNQQNKIFVIDNEELQRQLLIQQKNNIYNETTNRDLAYVIYTSGSTGQPKGVMIEHRGVVNYISMATRKYDLLMNEVILQIANYVFDASVEDMLLSLLNGHILLLVPNLLMDLDRYYYYLNTNKVTHLGGTPSFLMQYDFSEVPTLRRIIFGGEQLTSGYYDQLKKLNSNGVKVFNTYGPTETTIVATVNLIKENDVSIGKSIANTTGYIVDSSLTPLPIGAIGELYVGGVGLARGYLNRQGLTIEKFIENPFQTEKEKESDRNARLYKTGDLVRWLPDGNLEYIGRNDDQVKIRGYRIELGEVENALSSYGGVKQSVVLAKEHKGTQRDIGNKYLVGYYVADNKFDEEKILSYLQSRLPEYMVPSILVHLENLPLTTNGKLDKKILPEPEFGSDIDSYTAPRNELEEQLCKIWAKVLDLSTNQIGVNDNFFRLGGNSILVIKLLNCINKKLNINNEYLKVKTIYTHSTISKLSGLIQGNVNVIDRKIDFLEESKLDNNITPISSAPLSLEQTQVSIFLTGATGFVGVHLLHELGQNPKIDKIFCLVVANTESEAINRIYDALFMYNLPTNNFHKIIPILGTISEKLLGLNIEQFEEIADKTNIIIHSAVLMDHLQTYDSMKASNVHGTKEILRLACTKKQKTVHFISTTNVFSSNGAESLNNIYDEDSSIDDKNHYNSNGYGASKWVAEGLCNIARIRNINCNIYRLGLVLPSSKSYVFPQKQWFGRLLKACLTFNALPKEFANFKMQVACVDSVAKAIVHAVINTNVNNKNFHLFSSVSMPFSAIFNQMQSLFNCKETAIHSWLMQYEAARSENKIPVISAIESIIGSGSLLHQPSIEFASNKTYKFFNQHGIEFNLPNENYIKALLNQIILTTF